MLALIFILVMIAAALFGMMGLGSGIIYVPLLSWWGLDFATGAVPMGLLLSIATGAGAAVTYARLGLVHTRAGIAAASTVILGAPLARATELRADELAARVVSDYPAVLRRISARLGAASTLLYPTLPRRIRHSARYS